MTSYTLDINGAPKSALSDDPDKPLLYVLRDLGLTAAKYGCGEGQCGACAVLIDGKAERSCLLPVSAVSGRKIVTPEELGTVEKPHPVQAAFIAAQAAQCGYCTSGLVVASVALLAANPKPSETEIKQALAGHLCRCGSHARVIKAVKAASGQGG